MAAFLSICECGADISNYEHKFCTRCGRELLSYEKSIITFYFSTGFEYKSVLHNYCWHVDGYDKRKPYGFPIHGYIDGWSRKIMWLRLVRSNNLPETAASNFVDCVDDYGGCPVKLRTDCGTENVLMAAMQCEFRQDVVAHIYGPSPANQRIEGWWSFYRRNRSTLWINYFQDMIENDKFNPGSEIEK